MSTEHLAEIYVSLLEEGTPTWRSTKARSLGNGIYQLLPTENYDPEDEIWEFTPGSIVLGQERYTENGRKILFATRVFVSKEDTLKQHPSASLVSIHVLLERSGKRLMQKTEAIDLKNGLYKLLPTLDYDPQKIIWEFTPGSIVRVIKDTDEFGNKILLAFDQIREDRINGDYAQYTLKT
jgi:hypothetical protein